MKVSRLSAAVAPVVAAGLLVTMQAPAASAATFTAELVARHSQKCVSVAGVSTQNNAALVQWDCVEGSNQHFRLG